MRRLKDPYFWGYVGLPFGGIIVFVSMIVCGGAV